MNLRDQLTSVQNQLAEEKSKVVDRNAELIAQLEAREAELLQAIMIEDQNQASQLRVQEATEQAAYFLDNLVIEELTMRELCVGELQYQMLRIAVQNKIIDLAEENSKQLAELQTEENLQRVLIKQQLSDAMKKIEDNDKEAYEDHETIRQLRADLHQATLERNDFEGKLKNATDEIDRLNSQVDDLRKEIAVGARNAYKVTDVEQTQQLKQLADQIKAARIHVYDVVAIDINRANFSAKRTDNGEEVTYNWTQAKNYIEVTDPNEVEQFRTKHANQSAVQDPALDEPVQDSMTSEASFLELPSVEAIEVPDIAAVISVGDTASTDIGQSGQTVEERLSALEQSNLNMQTWIDSIEKRVGKLDGAAQAVA